MKLVGGNTPLYTQLSLNVQIQNGILDFFLYFSFFCLLGTTECSVVMLLCFLLYIYIKKKKENDLPNNSDFSSFKYTGLKSLPKQIPVI